MLLFPIHIEAGRELADLPGLLATSATARTGSRLRSQDLLVLFLSLSGNAPLSPSNQQELIKQMADVYFRSQGSVTAGLREMLVQMNQSLLDRNMKLSREGVRQIGVLNAAVLHGEILYVMHAGPTCTIASDAQHVQIFKDEDLPLRGLGLAKVITPQFHTFSVDKSALLILSPEPARGWSEGLVSALSRQPLDQVRKSLLLDPPLQLQAVVVKLQEGKGLVRLLRPRLAGSAETPPGGTIPVDEAKSPATIPQAESQRSKAESGSVDRITRPDTSSENYRSTLPTESGGNDLVTQSEITTKPTFSTPSLVSSPAQGDQSAVAVVLGKQQIKRLESSSSPQTAETSPAAVSPVQSRPGVWAGMKEKIAQVKNWLSQPAFKKPDSETVQTTSTTGSSVKVTGESTLVNTTSVDRSPGQAISPGKLEKFGSASLHFGQQRKPANDIPQVGEDFQAEPTKAERQPKKLPAWLGPAAKALDSAGKGLTGGLGKIGQAASTLIERSLPETTPGFTTALMTFIAVAVPVAVVAVATTFYLSSGRGQQHQAYYIQAEQMAALTSKQQDVNARRSGWQQVLTALDKADSYGSSDSSRTLRRQVQLELDQIEGVTRLPFQPAFPDRLDSTVNITRMVSNGADVYLLDGNQGRVFRLFRTAQGYDLDPKFNCGPVQEGGRGVGKLIDIAPIPANNSINPNGPPPAIIGMDVATNLVYCGPSLAGPISRSLTAPGSGWGKLAGFTVFQNSMYVLDTLNSLVWKYDSVDGALFSGDPILYFGRTIPPLADVIDIGAYLSDLFLLRSDGKMVTCIYATPGISTTRCTDPNPYGDSRSGREPAPMVFLDAKFDQIQVVRPPDPSIYILDVSSPSIYHFSLRLNLQKQYRVASDPERRLPQKAPTSFVVTSGRQVLLAYGNQVFLSQIP